jgi:hypothetical protein
MKRILSYLSIVVLTVAGVSCNKNLEPASIVLNHDVLNVQAGGETTTVGVKSNRDWEATVDQDWLTLTPASAEAFEASSYMILEVEPNNDFVREAVITVKAKSGEFTATMKVIQGEDGLVIKSAEQFIAFMELAASGEIKDNYRISRDIDLAGVELPAVAELAVSLDGQGCAITNWTTSAPMFEMIGASGSVSNLVLDSSCTLTLPAEHGNFGFITSVNAGTIYGIENYADVTIPALATLVNNAVVGVICGDCKGYIGDCSNYGNITYSGPIGTKNAYYAGVVGRVTGANAVADNLYNLGNVNVTIDGVTSTSLYFNGVVGTLNDNAKLLNSTNDGNVTVKTKGNNQMMTACGIVAYAGGEVSNCTNKGNIAYYAESAEGLADGAVQRTGVCGIAAYMGWAGKTVTDNHNEGEITLRAGYPLKYAQCGSAIKYSTNVAGVFGHIFNCKTDNCSNSGNVTSILGNIENAATYYGTDVRQSCAGVVASTWGEVSNCTNSGTILAQWITKDRTALAKNLIAQVGGIVGGDYNATGMNVTDIKNCVNSGDVTLDCDSKQSNNCVGGIAGYPTKENTATRVISDCENTGTIIADGQSLTRIGGISGGGATVKNSLNSGKVYVKSGQATCTVGGIVAVATGTQPITNCESFGDVVSDIKLAGAQGGSSASLGGIVGASFNQATITVTGCRVACNIIAPAGSTAFALVGVVGSNKSATTNNVFGTAEAPNVVKGGSIQLGENKVDITSENYLTYALPWGTGAPVNANIAYNTVWK